MAKVLTGLAIAQLSGSVAGTTYSRNRFGAYARNRATPTNPNTSYQQNIRGHLAGRSAAWAALTDAQRAAWANWAQTNPVTDSLGQKQVLSGHLAYTMLNTRLLSAGDTAISVPPVGAAPAALATVTGTYDIGAGSFQVAFTATPLAADDRLIVYAAVVDGAGINYVDNLLKQIQVSAKAQASPLDIETATTTRFGSLAVDQKVVVEVYVQDGATGLRSTPLRDEGLVVST